MIDPLLAHYLNGLTGVEMERQMIASDWQRQEGENYSRTFFQVMSITVQRKQF